MKYVYVIGFTSKDGINLIHNAFSTYEKAEKHLRGMESFVPSDNIYDDELLHGYSNDLRIWVEKVELDNEKYL